MGFFFLDRRFQLLTKSLFTYEELISKPVDEALAYIRHFPVFKHVRDEYVDKQLAKEDSGVTTVSRQELERLREVERRAKKRSYGDDSSSGPSKRSVVETGPESLSVVVREPEPEVNDSGVYEDEDGEVLEEELIEQPNYYTRGVGRGKTSHRSRVARVLGDRAGVPRTDAWSVRNQERRRGQQEQRRQQLRGGRRGNRGVRGQRGVRGVRGGRIVRGGRGIRRGGRGDYRQQQ